MSEVFKHFTTLFGSTVKSIPVDHGKEFSDYRALQKKHDISVYFNFCHAFSHWVRETNKLFNRRLIGSYNVVFIIYHKYLTN